MSGITIVKSTGEEEIFNEEKLIRSLEKSGANEEEINRTVRFVKSKLRMNMSTGNIYSLAYKNLNSYKKSNVNAVRYSLKKSVMELGPTGFPFEKFIARIFVQMGYRCKTGVMVKGNCIEHEVDIFAYNAQEVICIEAKFHNEPHLRSDTKVVLYVKSRFDDLINQNIMIGDDLRKITKGILITNTNFTDTAQYYVNCVNTFQLMSWNKPRDESLLFYIEKHKLYPIGVVPELSQKEMLQLIENDIITCIDLKNNPSILEKIGMRNAKRQIVIKTINEICNH